MTYPSPKRATYRPSYHKLSYAVLVLGQREMFGRTEYEIQSMTHPETGTAWVTAGANGQQLQFQEESHE